MTEVLHVKEEQGNRHTAPLSRDEKGGEAGREETGDGCDNIHYGVRLDSRDLRHKMTGRWLFRWSV